MKMGGLAHIHRVLHLLRKSEELGRQVNYMVDEVHGNGVIREVQKSDVDHGVAELRDERWWVPFHEGPVQHRNLGVVERHGEENGGKLLPGCLSIFVIFCTSQTW